MDGGRRSTTSSSAAVPPGRWGVTSASDATAPPASSTPGPRVAHLLDKGTFSEIGTLVGDVPADAFVAGSGLIDGRPVMVGVEDFTVVAGTIACGQQRQAPPPRRGGPPGAGAARDGARGCRLPPDRPLARQLARRPADAGAVLRATCPSVTAVLGASAGHGALVAADLRLRGDDGDGVDLHGRTAGGEGGDRRGGRQALARRAVGGGAERPRPQRRARRRRGARPGPRVPLVLPVERVVVPRIGRAGRRTPDPSGAGAAGDHPPRQPPRVRHARRPRRRARRRRVVRGAAPASAAP